MRSLFWLTEVRHIALTKSVEKFRLGAYMVKGCEGKSTQKKMLSETPGRCERGAGGLQKMVPELCG